MTQKFSSKAGTLAALYGVLRSARILPLCAFTVADWRRDAAACLLRVRQHLSAAVGQGSYIVRSSCAREDNHETSNAGAFLSLMDVREEQLPAAIAEVIAAYGADVQDSDEVLIQPMLRRVLRSGVAFSHDPNTAAPYRVVNWQEGDDTAAVTGGKRADNGKIWQQAAASPVPAPPFFAPILALLDELSARFGQVPIDCEFAMTANRGGKHSDPKSRADESGHGEEQLWLLQVRPLLLSRPPQTVDAQREVLTAIEQQVARGMRPHPFLMGKRTVYGVMPDWNPAEIVGIRPKPLALSLYRELVTDATWAYQRHNYGYRNLRSFPLMPHFFGLPYIDVRLSFNSFIAADLDAGLAGRLVDYYIERLLHEPALHDKVEFEIVFSCYTLDVRERLAKLADFGFSATERDSIADSLCRLTNRIVRPQNSLWQGDADKLNVLQARRKQLLSSSCEPLERIYWLLEDGKRYGTLPFAGLARAGFVAVQMLKSLVAVGVFSAADYDAFLNSVSTVSGQLARDRATLDKAGFLARYGHLRPGTYDILSPRYDEAPNLYFDWQETPPAPPPVQPFSLTLPQMRDIVKLLARHGLQADAVGLFDFMQAGIEQREWAKFHFTRNLSDALSLIGKVGATHGFSVEDLAYCDVAVFREMYVGASKQRSLLQRSIEQGKARYADTLAVALPPLLTEPADVWAFFGAESSPNFITQKHITAHAITLNRVLFGGAAGQQKNCRERGRGSKLGALDDIGQTSQARGAALGKEALAGAIVCIPNADPGFDWLFAHPIAGLITAWGGVNSHMAIRAGELGLPAVIGAGEHLYRRWSSAKRLHLDCAGRRVDVLA